MKISRNSRNAFFAAALLGAAVATAAGAPGSGPKGPPVKTVSTDTPDTTALRDRSGDFAMNTLSLDGNLNLPTTSATTGIIEVAGVPFIHSFGSYNTFLGQSAGNLTMTGGGNLASGSFALGVNTTGSGNTAVGPAALYANTTGNANTATGDGALQNNTIGGGNTATGSQALQSNTTGVWNTAIGGSYTLVSNTTGTDNTGVGTSALFANTTGSRNIAVGSGAGQNIDGNDDNIDIGNQGVDGDGNTIRIGSAAQNATFIAGIRGRATGNNDAVAVVIDSNGQLGTINSSRRYKEDIRDMAGASDRLLRLRPVTFRYKKPFADGEKPIQYGLIAEEVAEVFPDLVAYGQDRRPETVKYQTLSSLLLNEFQKQHAKIQDQASQVARLTAIHASDQAEMISLKKELTEQRTAFAALASRVSNMERKAATTELARREVGAN